MTTPQVAIDAAQFYRGRGISRDAAVAIVSCLWCESKLRPGSQGKQSTETPGTLNPGGAYGIASWNGPRQQALSIFAQKQGLRYSDLNTQLLFVLTESANSYPGVWAAITGTQSYDQIIQVFVAQYENPQDHTAEINAAMLFANGLYAAIPFATPQQVPTPQLVAPQPVGVSTLDPVLLSIVEALLSGLVKAILQQVAVGPVVVTPAAHTSTAVPAVDPSALAKLIATELSSLIQTGVKQ